MASGTLRSIELLNEQLPEQDALMPVLFIGHGSPMNGIEHNIFSNKWAQVGKSITPPKAIIVISAHWLTNGTAVTAMNMPRTIHDFGGFPKELFAAQYPAPGNPELAQETRQLITGTKVLLNHDWGLDHGAWTVLTHMFPQHNVPVIQLSIDYSKPAAFHYKLGRELLSLRKKGVLIMGSGNMVHNLGMVDWKNLNKLNYGYDWAIEMHEVFKRKITDGNHKDLMDYHKMGRAAELAIPTPDHYFPLMYVLGLQQANEQPEFFNDILVAGSLNMTSVKFG